MKIICSRNDLIQSINIVGKAVPTRTTLEILYCILISGMRGLPGWALGNAVIGVALGWTFRLTRGMRSAFARTAVHCLAIAASTAVGILIAKSLTESVLYMQPMALRIAPCWTSRISWSVSALSMARTCSIFTTFSPLP